MPGFDQTGPLGQGPMSGRGMGNCSGTTGTGRSFGFRRGRGMGPGRGQWYGFNRIPNDPDEKQVLEKQIQNCQNQLQHMQNRLDQLQQNEE